MKKAISLILVAVICLTLCACGKSKAVTNVEDLITAIGTVTAESEAAIAAAEAAYSALNPDEQNAVLNYAALTAAREELLFLQAQSLFEAGQYEDALALLNQIGSYKKVADQIAYMEAYRLEQERLAREAEYAARPRETVQITADNLETYFEFLSIPYFDAFGQLDTIACKIFPRDGYLDRIDYGSGFQIDILYKAEGVTATVEYDAATNTFTYGGPLPGWGGTMLIDDILSVSNDMLGQIAAQKPENPGSEEIRFLGNFWTDSIYHEYDMNGCSQWSLHIEQVQGTLVLFAE